MATWKFVKDSLLIGRFMDGKGDGDNHFGSTPRIKVASFDLDSTLIETKSGKLHAKDASDWIWWDDAVPQKLKQVHNDGYRVIVFTNQGRLTTSKGDEAPEAQMFRLKMEAILKVLDIPLTLYAACANDNYRKPRTGMWEEMVKENCREVELESSYLVGDAAGRIKDHSDSDTHFSVNIGLKFFTPEEFFLGSAPEAFGHKFDPMWYLDGNGLKTYPFGPQITEQASVSVLVGLPGAGKTTYYRKVLEPQGYMRISPPYGELENDCSELASKLLVQGKSIVIDSTNFNIEARQVWVSLARNNNATVRALNFTTPVDLCLHNDTVRALGGPQMNPEMRPIFARIPFRKMEAVFTKADITEGFAEVLDIDFMWNGTEEELQIWKRHWL